MLTREEFNELIKILNDSMYNDNIWDIDNAQLLHYYNNNMIRIPLLPHVTIDSNTLNLEFDDKLCINDNTYSDMDIDNTTIHSNNDNKYFGQLDIIVSDTYNIPCPYILIYDCRGLLLNLSDVQSLLTKSIAEHNHEVEILIDEHPIHGIPCYTYHVCGLGEALASMNTFNQIQRFISWLSIIGRYIGLSISTDDFHKIQSIYQEEDIINNLELITLN